MKRFASAAALLLLASAASASTVVGLSIEDQARLSRLVVVGEVKSMKAVELPESGLETAVTLELVEVLKGEAQPGRRLVFHTRGGASKDVVSKAVGEAELHVGTTVLVFVEDVGGRLYNLGLSAGVWNVHADDRGEITYTRALTDGLEFAGDEPVELGPIAADEMSGRVAWTLQDPELDSSLLQALLPVGR